MIRKEGILRCIAIDPALTSGFAWRDDRGELRVLELRITPGKGEYGKRYWEFLQCIVERLDHDEIGFPEKDDVYIVYEQSKFLRGVNATRNSFGFEAVLAYFCFDYGIPLIGVYGTELKKWAYGKGNATKEQMLEASKRFGYTGESFDIADAVCLLAFAEENCHAYFPQQGEGH